MLDLDELRRKLLWNGPPTTDGRFLSVFIDQNNRCNLRCRMCGFSDSRVAALRKFDLPRAAYDRIAADVFPRASRLCLSLFTEPLMTRDFPSRLAAVRRYGVPFSEFYTNATVLTDEAVDAIEAAGITRVTVSIDGGTKEVFESIRVGASFETVIRNYRRLRCRRRINHVLMEENIDSFGEMLALVESLAPEEIVVRPVSRMSNAEIQESRDAAFWAKVAEARETLAAFCRRTGIEDTGFLRDTPAKIDVGLSCRFPWTTIAIHHNGDVYPCMAWSRPPVGNLLRQSFDEIWNGAPLVALREEFERTQPGVDCLHCTIRRGDDDADDDFFYRKLAAPPVEIALTS
jgi:radical SAM protein with 4Fe4S-binding SPASM domain